jgi:hypothetical protein
MARPLPFGHCGHDGAARDAIARRVSRRPGGPLSTKLRRLKVQVAMLVLAIVGLVVAVVVVLTFPAEL